MAEQAVIRIDVDTGEGRASVEQLESSLEELDVAAVEAGDGMERVGVGSQEAAADMQRAEQQMSRVSAEARSMSSSTSGAANQLGFELVQASQDAAFGIENVANQAPLLAEQFTRLRQQSGGTTGALTSLVGALKGPAGVIGAITLLLTFKEQLIGFFTDTEEAAKSAAEETESAIDSLLTRLADERDLQRITQITRQIREQQEALEGLPPDTQIGIQTEEGEFIPSEERTAFALQVPAGARAITAAERQEQLQTELERVLKQRQKIRDEVSRRNALQRAGIDLSEQQTSELEAQLGTIREQVGPVGALQEPGVVEQDVPRAPTGVGDRRPGVGPGGGLESAIERGTRRQMRQMPSAEVLQDRVTRAAMAAGESVDENVNQQLAQGIRLASQLGTTLVQSAREGSLTFQQAFSSILGVVGSVLGGPAGAAIAGGAQLIGSFQSGGIVDTPLQIVGESGPELAAMPRGTRVSSNRDTMAMMERMIQAVEGREVAVPVRNMRDEMVQADLEDGERSGSVVVANVDQL